MYLALLTLTFERTVLVFLDVGYFLRNFTNTKGIIEAESAEEKLSLHLCLFSKWLASLYAMLA